MRVRGCILHRAGRRRDGRTGAGAVGGHALPGHELRGRRRIPQGSRRIRQLFRRALGFEFDFERYSHFFKDKDVANLVPNNCGTGPAGEPCTDLNADAAGFMANVVAPSRIKGAKNWRPYATAGLGVTPAWVTDPSNQVVDTNQNNLAFSFGGGVMYSLNNRVGLRGDVRYFRALVDEDQREGFYFKDYSFWRTTIGVTFGFPR
jgi:opacity protein-like surface antigen